VTYARKQGTFAAAFTAAVGGLGARVAAAVTGVSEVRLRNLANPCRPDSATLDHAVALDVAAAKAGQGTPILDAYLAQLAASGVRPLEQQLARARAVVEQAVALLRGEQLAVMA
jgi:hypothetical protein